MACRQKAIFLISWGMYQLLRLPAGKKTFLVGDKGFARDDVKRFVDGVIPGKAAGAARPGHDG
jgi:hypothetical protein